MEPACRLSNVSAVHSNFQRAVSRDDGFTSRRARLRRSRGCELRAAETRRWKHLLSRFLAFSATGLGREGYRLGASQQVLCSRAQADKTVDLLWISMDGDVDVAAAENLISSEKQQVVCGGARPTKDTLSKSTWAPI